MSRLAQAKLQAEKDSKKPQPKAPSNDKRNLASKAFDMLNPIDGGRSWDTATPSKEGKKKSGATQANELMGSLFGNTAKLANSTIEGASDAVELGRALTGAATGNAAAENAAVERGLKNKSSDKGSGIFGVGGVIDSKEAQTAISPGRMAKKIVGTGAGAAGEILPVGKGAQVAKIASKKAVEEGGAGLSRMARAKLASQTAKEGAVVGAAGGAGSTAADDNTDLTTAEGQNAVLKAAGFGAVTGGVMGGAGAMMPSIKPVHAYNAKIGANPENDLAGEVSRGSVNGTIEHVPTKSLKLGTDTVSDPLDKTTVKSYKQAIKNGDELDPIIVDEKGNVQDGAHRLEAAKQLGIENIPVVRKVTQEADNAVPTEVADAIPAKTNIVAAAAVDKPTEVASLTAPVTKGDTVSFHKVEGGKVTGVEDKTYKVNNTLETGGKTKVELVDDAGKSIWTTPDGIQKVATDAAPVEPPIIAYHGSTDNNLTSLVPGAKTGLNEKRNLLYLTEDKNTAKDYTKVRGTDGTGLGELTDSKTGTVYKTEVNGKVLGAYDRPSLDALKSAPGYEKLSGKTKNSLTNDTGLSPEILESNDELTGFLKDNGITAVRTHLPNTKSTQLVVVNPDNINVLPTEPTLTNISDAAGGRRPDADIQKEIETAHNSGDTNQVEHLITQLSPEMQAPMRSALGLPETPSPVVPTAQILDEPVQMKVLDDVQNEADTKAPTKVHNQTNETKTQKGAQYIVDDLDKLQKETGIDVQPIDRQLAGALTGETRRSTMQEFFDHMGRNFQDTLTYAARTLGKTGTEFVYDMLKGNKFKRDTLDSLRDPMHELAKINKKISGKSLTSRRDVGARIGAALDDRANASTYLKNEDEKKLFDHYVNIFDTIKALREKAGLETVENYRPWVNMKEAAEPPAWLADNVTTKKTQTVSRFSKERTRTEAGDKVDNNLADMIYGYVNSQLNELAYDAPVRRFKDNFDNLTAGNKANVANMNDGVDYLHTLVQQAVNPQRKNPLERGAAKLTSNVYGSVLPFNVRLAIQNKTQKFVANSRVSKGALRLVGRMDGNDLKDLESGLVFGDQTVYGQLEDANSLPKGAGKSVRERVSGIDPYQHSEKDNVISSYNKGVAQAVLDSDAYKNGIKSGLKPKDAAKAALKDPATREAAIRRGNVVVNDTQFGASPLSRPEMLREEGSIWGVLPKKTIYMFTRFPIGMSQHTLEVLNNKNARALELLKNGDPRAMSVAEMRTNYKALLSSMKDAKTALDNNEDIGIPKDVLNKQIEFVSQNIKTIDNESKKLSQIRAGKTLKNLGKMWVAAAAIQIVFDGGINSFADDPVGTSEQALGKTNPTMGNRVVGQYSPLASISSSASPLDRYGKVNTRAVANYIPGVGLAVNRGRDIGKLYNSLMGDGSSNQ